MKKSAKTAVQDSKTIDNLQDLSFVREIFPTKEDLRSFRAFNKSQVLPKVGMSILFPVSVFKDRMEKLNPFSKITEAGSFMIKYEQGAWMTRTGEFVALPDYMEKRSRRVAFCNEPVPDNCIGFWITGFSKTGETTFVKPIKGDIADLFSRYSMDPSEVLAAAQKIHDQQNPPLV